MARQIRHSASSVTTYERCPRQWDHKYVRRDKPPERSVPWHYRRGIVVHAALESAFVLHRDGRGPEPDSMVAYLEHAEARARDEWVKQGMGDPVGGDWHETMRQVGLSLDSCEVPRRSAVLGVEHKVIRDTEDGTPVMAFLDLAVELSADTALVRDWKTNNHERSAESMRQDFQLAWYAVLARLLWPHLRQVYVSHFHTPAGRENRVLMPPEAQDEASSRFEAVVEMMEADLISGRPTRTRPGSACATCPFTHLCPDSAVGGALRTGDAELDEASAAMSGF